MKEISDKEVLKESLNHPEAFSIIYERYHDKIFSHVYKLVQSVEVTKDITEETFLGMIKYRKTILKSGAPLDRYIYRMSTNNAFIYFRDEKRKRKGQEKLYTEQNMGKYSSNLDENDDEELVEAINNLPEIKRICVIMYYFEDKNIEEIALILNKGKSTIGEVLKEARKDLYDALRKKFDGKA